MDYERMKRELRNNRKLLYNNFWVVSFFDGKINCVLMASDATRKSVDIPLEAAYDSFDELPEWARKRIAVLEVMHPEDGSCDYISRVGRRSSRDCYWLFVGGEDVNER